MGEFDLTDRKKLVAKTPGAMNVVLVMIVMIAALVSLGELSITPTGVVNVSLTVAVIYIISSIMYKNSYADGIVREKQSEEFKKAEEEYKEALRNVYEEGMLTEMPALCIRYCEEELKACRHAVLLDSCIPYDTYEEKYLGKSEKELEGMKLSKDAIRCISAANKIKGLHLTANTLLSTGEEATLGEKLLRKLGWRRGIAMESRTRQHIDTTFNMISRAITTFLAGTVAISVALDDFSLETLALWAMKMMPVAISVLGGRNGGTRNVQDTLIPQMQKKTKIINILLSWHKNEKHRSE